MRTPFLLALLTLCCLSHAQVECKDVNAPPSDIIGGVVTLPAVETCAADAVSALFFSDELTDDHMVYTAGGGKSGVVLLGPGADAWTLRASSEAAPWHDALFVDQTPLTPAHAARAVRTDGAVGGVAFSITPPAPDERCAVLIADGAEEVRLRTWAGAHERTPGAPMSVHVACDGAEVLGARIIVTDPAGDVTEHKVRGGVAVFVPRLEGDHAVRTIARVRDGAGVLRWRTTQSVWRVSAPLVTLDDAPASVVNSDDARVEITIPVRTLGRETKLIVAAEVWGTDGAGGDVPVCWAARVQRVTPDTDALRIGVDPAWITAAGVRPGTLELRAVRVHDTGGACVVAYRDAIPLEGARRIPAPQREPRTALRTGAYVQGGHARSSGRSLGGHVLMFSHGYCAGGNPFDVSDFSGDLEAFSDPDQNRSHDEFALLIEQRGRDVKSMGLVAHSQGGCASAHLFTFYWSALDWAQGPNDRLIQTVGTPWQGTPLAGNVAGLGAVFGAGCGQNTDLSTSGAPVWLSTIPTSTRQRITYYTTAFEDGPFYDFCQFVTDFLLADPDDGVIENVRGQLPGANNGGFVEGWCHSTGMRDPPQCEDASRNTILDQEAAR